MTTVLTENQRGRAQLGSGNLVGRRELVAEVSEALRPGPAAVMLEGEPGVGKTTVADRVAVEIADQLPGGGLRLRLAATRAGRRIPLAPFAALLTSEADFSENALAFLPRAISAELHRRAPGAEVVIHVDDVHHFDPASARVLDALIRLEEFRFVLTCRKEPGAGPEVMRLWRDGLLARFTVPPLKTADVQALIVGHFEPDTVEIETIKRIEMMCEGNPLFLGELLRSFGTGGQLRKRRGVITWAGRDVEQGSIAQVVRAELAELEASQREALEVIALSEPVRASVLQRLVAAADVTALFSEGFIARDKAIGADSGEARLRIAHPVYADAVRSLVSPSRRLELYRALYRDTEHSDAMSPTELMRAVGWAVSCGVTCPMGWLVRAHGLSQALHDQDLTIMVTGAVIIHPETDALRKVTALIDRSHAHRILGQAGRAQRDAEEAGRLVEDAVGSGAADLDAALPALVLRQALAAADVEQYQWDNIERSLTHLDKAERVLATMRGGEAALRSLAVERALRAGFAGDFSGAMEQIESVQKTMRGSVDLLPLRSVQILILGQRGRTRRARMIAMRALPKAAANTDIHPWAAGEIVSAWFVVDLMAGNLTEAGKLNDRVLEALERDTTGVAFVQALAFLGNGLRASAEGRWTQAETYLRSACLQLDETDGTGFARFALSALALALAASGQAAEARSVREDSESTLLRGSRSIESQVRYNLLMTDLWLGEDRDGAKGLDFVAWCRERELHLMELRGIHAVLVSETHPRGAAGAPLLARAHELANLVDAPIAAPLVRHSVELVEGATNATGVPARQLARHGLWVPVGGRARGLTTREHEVAALAALGFSNRSIAERLFLSKRTVETHLGRAFGKLGISDRDDLAAALSANGQ